MADRSEEARLKAEASFRKKEEQAQEADKVWAEQAAASQAADEQRARLKALRLAKETAEPEPKTKRNRQPAAPNAEALAHEEEQRGILPTHRPTPVRPSRARKKRDV